MICLNPLRDSHGKVRFVLGGQTDATETMQQILPVGSARTRQTPPNFSATVQDQLDRLQPPINHSGGNGSAFVTHGAASMSTTALVSAQPEYPYLPPAAPRPSDLLPVPGPGLGARPSSLQRGRGLSKVWKRNHNKNGGDDESSIGNGTNGKRKNSSEADKASIAPSLATDPGLVRSRSRGLGSLISRSLLTTFSFRRRLISRLQTPTFGLRSSAAATTRFSTRRQSWRGWSVRAREFRCFDLRSGRLTRREELVFRPLRRRVRFARRYRARQPAQGAAARCRELAQGQGSQGANAPAEAQRRNGDGARARVQGIRPRQAADEKEQAPVSGTSPSRDTVAPLLILVHFERSAKTTKASKTEDFKHAVLHLTPLKSAEDQVTHFVAM